MSANPVPRLTPEQFLAADREAEFKSTLRGALLIANCCGELSQASRGRSFTAYAAPRVRATRSSYLYSDVAVVCGLPQVADDQNDILLNPTVIVRVLCESTEGDDRGLKFHRYGRIESLKEYVLVSQDAPRVEVFRRRDDARWLWSPIFGLNAVCRLESLDCAIPLADIFEGVEFTPDQLDEAAGG